MERHIFKYCVADVMKAIADSNSFHFCNDSAYRIANKQEQVFIDKWNELYGSMSVAMTQKQALGPNYSPLYDSCYGDIYIYDLHDLKVPAYNIDLKVAAHSNRPSDTIGTVTVLSLSNFTATDTNGTHYYLVSSFDAKTYKLFRANRLLDLLVQWYSSSEWKIPMKDGKYCTDYIWKTKKNVKPSYLYKEHWTSDRSDTSKTYVHPKMMEKMDEDYVPEFVIKHFYTLN